MRKSEFYKTVPGFIISLLLPVMLLFLCDEAVSQEIVYKQLKDVDGLPSNTIYDILQDKEGYIWLSTDFGVVKYDGFNFENINMPQEMRDKSVIRLYMDPQERIWFHTYGGGLYYYQDDSVFSAERLNQLMTPLSRDYIDRIRVDSTGRIWLAPLKGGVYLFQGDSVRMIYPGLIESSRAFIQFDPSWGSEWFAVISDTIPRSDYKANDEIIIPFHTRHTGSFRNYLNSGGTHDYLAVQKTLYQLKDGMIVDSLTFHQNIASIYLDSKGALWVSVFFEGTYRFIDMDLESTPVHYFEDQTVSRVFEDAENNFWFTTTNDGVYVVPDLGILRYRLENNLSMYQVISISGSGERVFITTYDQHVYYLDLAGKTQQQLRELNLGWMKNYAYDILADQHGNVWVASTEHLCYDRNGNPLPFDTVTSPYLFFEASDGTFYMASSFLVAYENRRKIFNTYPDPGVRIHCMVEDDRGRIWLGSKQGLYLYNNNTIVPYDENPKLNDLRITDLEVFRDRLLIGTTTKGLLSLNLENDSVEYFKDEYLGERMIRKMMSMHDSLLWVGTKQGLYRFAQDISSGELEYSGRKHTGNGLPSNDVNDLFYMNGSLWIGTNAGMVSMDPYKPWQKSKTPFFEIKRVFVNGEEKNINELSELESDENNIRLEFAGRTFRGPSNLNFRYLLSGHDQNIIYTENNYASYSNIPPGEYTFFLNAGNAEGNYSSQPRSVSIIIEKHITDKTGFVIFMIIAGLGVVSGITFLVFNYFQYRSVISRDLLVTRHQLLRSQMNPHFLFNALLAVQSFVYKNNPAEAAKYLSSFSKLMRLTLTSSRKEVIPLDKEIEFLRNYLDLQKLRYGGKFDYAIEIRQDVIPERVAIPPLLAQPFIENAVEHGIRTIKHKGFIQIRYTMNGDELQFEVEDNGVGMFSEARKKDNSSTGSEPLGIKITEERLRLLRRISGRRMNISIREIKDEHNETKGTIVSFSIQYTDV